MAITRNRNTTVHSIVDSEQQHRQAKQDKEIEDYKLIGNGGWPNFALLLFSCLLGYWIFRLFIDPIPASTASSLVSLLWESKPGPFGASITTTDRPATTSRR